MTLPGARLLAATLKTREDATSTATWATGSVTSSTATTVTVDVAGSPITCPYFRSYAPLSGDVVMLAGAPGQWYCLGSITPGSSAAVTAQNVTTVPYGLTTYAAVAGTGVVFVAPLSGSVLVEVSAALLNTTAGAGVLATPVVLTGGTIGSGSSVLAANDLNCISNNNANYIDTSRSTLVTGLTPAATYNAQMYMRSGTATTANVARGRVIVTPLAT